MGRGERGEGKGKSESEKSGSRQDRIRPDKEEVTETKRN